jgi:prepilin-type N-terminal cleavage/methylation domain-containing protein
MHNNNGFVRLQPGMNPYEIWHGLLLNSMRVRTYARDRSASFVVEAVDSVGIREMNGRLRDQGTRDSAPGRAAFTLIEMLVVIGVIGILVGMLFPALRRAQAKSRQAACMNTLHQFGLGIVQYRHDHDEKMPPWLSALYPDYISGNSVYVCPSDGSRGQEGGKPDNSEYVIGDQFVEVDDKESNPLATNRCDVIIGGRNAIPVCSYFYEFADVKCESFPSGWYLGADGSASTGDVDENKDGVATWGEVKEYQLYHGDRSHPSPYNETDFPMVRCFHHLDEKEIRAKQFDIDGTFLGLKEDRLTLNLSYSGNVFPAPIKWEEKP